MAQLLLRPPAEISNLINGFWHVCNTIPMAPSLWLCFPPCKAEVEMLGPGFSPRLAARGDLKWLMVPAQPRSGEKNNQTRFLLSFSEIRRTQENLANIFSRLRCTGGWFSCLSWCLWPLSEVWYVLPGYRARQQLREKLAKMSRLRSKKSFQI